MTQWTTLTPIDLADYLAAETRAKAETINAAIGAILTGRAELDSDRSALADNAEQLGGKMFKKNQELKARELDLLTAEIGIRQDLATFFELQAADASRATDEAFADIEKVKADVRKKLVKIGYVDVAPTIQAIGKITNGMILCHPAVHEAIMRHTSLRGVAQGYEHRDANKAAMVRVREAVAQACR